MMERRALGITTVHHIFILLSSWLGERQNVFCGRQAVCQGELVEVPEEGLARAAYAIREGAAGLDLAKGGLTVLIENTAGAEYSLGASFEQVAALVGVLREFIPVAACMDTCHLHVAGYDIVTPAGYEATLRQIDETIGLKNVPVWHCNDAKAALGSKLDRHQHIGQGTIGAAPFKRLLNDPRLAHAAFIAETPIDEPGDDRRNVEMLKSLVKRSRSRKAK